MSKKYETKKHLKKIKDAYENWYDDLIKSYINRCIEKIDKNTFLKKYCLFFTMTFAESSVVRERTRLGLVNGDYSVEIDAFNFVYVNICENLFGRKWNRKKFEHKLPSVIMSIDFEGSRYSYELSGNHKNVHIHAIWIIHPDEMDKFERFIKGPRFCLGVLDAIHIDKVQWEHYRKARAPLKRLCSYATKAWIKSERKPLAGELFRIYPNTNYGGTPYKAIHTYARANRMLNKLRLAAAKECRDSRMNRSKSSS